MEGHHASAAPCVGYPELEREIGRIGAESGAAQVPAAMKKGWAHRKPTKGQERNGGGALGYGPQAAAEPP